MVGRYQYSTGSLGMRERETERSSRCSSPAEIRRTECRYIRASVNPSHRALGKYVLHVHTAESMHKAYNTHRSILSPAYIICHRCHWSVHDLCLMHNRLRLSWILMFSPRLPCEWLKGFSLVIFRLFFHVLSYGPVGPEKKGERRLERRVKLKGVFLKRGLRKSIWTSEIYNRSHSFCRGKNIEYTKN